jgi:aspartate-semialdehyde dehydrogenase
LITESLIPEIDNPMENNFTKEEIKMVEETKKILKDNDIDINATCVRVPLLRTHAVSIYLETSKEIDLNLLKSKYLENKSIILLDDLKKHIYPVGEKAFNNDYVYIGRIRKSLNNPKGLLLYVVSDNLRKGAASNMVQILEYLIKKRDIV